MTDSQHDAAIPLDCEEDAVFAVKLLSHVEVNSLTFERERVGFGGHSHA
jgi:hypothetical protein